MFEKKNKEYYFAGKYQLIETTQAYQPDVHNVARRVFVFHLQSFSFQFRGKEIETNK